jgi:hypothetical protein
MTKRPRQLEPEQFTEIKHFRSAEEFDFAIDKLKRRLSEIEALKGLSQGDQRIENPTQNSRNTILDIFGPNSPEYGEQTTDLRNVLTRPM